MKTYPLKSLTITQAMEKQFKLIDEITKISNGYDFLNLGDLGVEPKDNKPQYVTKVEKILASYFETESCVLVTGAGTGAIRFGLAAICKPGQTLLIHDAPIYPTTLTTIEMFGIKTIKADFNDLDTLRSVVSENQIDAALIQHTRQKPQDSYILEEVINTIKINKDIPIIIDENYAAMKVEKIGCQLNADLSTFSAFKLLGPEGVGVVVGKKVFIDKVEEMNYSGGSKVQGWQANEVLRGLSLAPVSLAIQSEVVDTICEVINNSSDSIYKSAFVANAQSKVVIVEFSEDIAQEVLQEAIKRGAAAYPVGAESKYEMAPMFYRLSGTFRAYDPSFVGRMIRINPMRSGVETVLRILEESIKAVKECS